MNTLSLLLPRDRRGVLLPLVLGVALLALIALSLTFGRYPVSMSEVARIVFTTGLGARRAGPDPAWVVVEIVRMPRILGVVVCGMGLALAGAALQGVFRNPLVGPEVVGVSAGASFGGVIAILLMLPTGGIVGLAFAGGMTALAAAFALARLARGGMLALILAGVIVGGFFGALTGLTEYVADPSAKLPSILYWLLGSFVGMSWDRVAVLTLVTFAAGTLLLSLRWRINLLSLSDEDAQALGVRVEWLRWSVVSLASLMVAAQVAVSGGVAWVGLIVPHIARMLTGAEHSRLMPVSALTGGIYMLVIDNIARSATSQEIPVGLLTALVGMPAFATLLWKMGARGWSDE